MFRLEELKQNTKLCLVTHLREMNIAVIFLLAELYTNTECIPIKGK